MSCLTLAVALSLSVGAQQPISQQQSKQQPSAQHSNPVAIGQQQAKSPMDGTWTILCCEKGGQKMGSGQHGTVTIQGSVLSCKIDGKEHRAHLMFGPNHMLTAWAEAPQQGSSPQHKDGKVASEQPATPASELTRGNPGQVQADARPNQQLLPGVGGQPNAPRQGSHHGVYILANDFLCVALDQPFIEEEHKQTASGTAKPGTLTSGQTAGRSGEQGTTPQAKPGTPTAGQPGANPVAGGQQPANNLQQQGSNLALPSGQAGTDLAERIRRAGYGPGIAAPAQQSEQHGFVLILHREGGMQQRDNNAGRER
jgi:hypothetical protein